MIRVRPIAALAAALLFAAASPAPVHAQPTAVEGVARAEDGGEPIPFALVRLVPVDSTASPSAPAQGITDAEGRFRFGGIAAGSYRVQLLRVGYRPVLSDSVQVAAGETAQLSLHVATQPVELPEVTVRAGDCVTGAALGEHPQLLMLWEQGRDGASIREGLLARYRFRSVTREEGFERRDDGPTPPHAREDTLISDPRWALANAARRRMQRLARGYAGPRDGWVLPNELDVLHEDFLRSHCIDPVVKRGDGELGLRFRPMRTRRGIRDVRVTLWLDAASYLTRRLELEYVEDDEPRGTVRVDYGDVAVAGGMLRMPIRGAYLMRPSRKNPAKVTEGTLAFSYSDFEEARPR